MEAYAVIATGGKQYRIQAGDVLDIEKIDAEAGSKVTLSDVLAVSDGKALKVGTPLVEGAAVKAEIVGHLRAKKVVSFKRRRRKGYKKKIGHRQGLTKIKVVSCA